MCVQKRSSNLIVYAAEVTGDKQEEWKKMTGNRIA
jgi:hypothetical protein